MTGRHAPCRGARFSGRNTCGRRASAFVLPVLTLAVTMALLASGCAVGPDFQPPAAPVATRYTAQPLAAPGGAAQRFVDAQDIPADWWALFHSDALNALIVQALAANPDLQAADASLRAAREATLAQQGALWPSADVQYSPIRQSVAAPVASPVSSGSSNYTLHTAQLNIAYVPDVFGANRRAVESLQAEAEVQRFQLAAAQVSLTANIVAGVIQQASLRAQIEATHALVASAAKQLELLRRAQALGQNGAADVAAQESLLAQTQATLPPLEKQLAAQGNQLAVLAGRLPADGPLPDIALDALLLPAELPLSLPAKLVEQRPDIRAADAQLHAASAQIGVAVANRLPNLSLTAGAGSSALQFSKLFSAGTGFWSLSANLAQPLFDGGSLLHRERAARANYDQAAAMYRGTVQVAFQNVADALDAIQSDAKALDALVLSERAAERSLAIARKQRAAGAIGTLTVLTAEQAYGQATLARTQAQANRLADTVGLFQALGGGWWNRGETAEADRDRMVNEPASSATRTTAR